MTALRRQYVSVLVGFVLGVIVVGVPAYVVGLIAGNLRIYHNICEKESVIIGRILDSDPDFSGVRTRCTSQGMCTLEGRVASDEAYSRLKAAVEKELG